MSFAVRLSSKLKSCGTTPISSRAPYCLFTMSRPRTVASPPWHAQPDQHADQRRLARAVGAQQPEKFALADVEVDAVYCDKLVKRLGEAA